MCVNPNSLNKVSNNTNWLGDATTGTLSSGSSFSSAANTDVFHASDLTSGGTSGSASYLQNWGYGAQALGGILSARATNDQYNSMISAANANLQRTYDQINMVGHAGSQAANDARAQGRTVQSQQHAQMGASGFSSNSGSNAAIQASTAGNAEENAQRIQYNTNLQEWGLTNQANNYKAQIANYQNAQKTSKLGSLLTTATNLAKMYYGYGGVG